MPAHQVLHAGGQQIERTMLDNFPTNSSMSQKQASTKENNSLGAPTDVMSSIKDANLQNGKPEINYQDQSVSGKQKQADAGPITQEAIFDQVDYQIDK